MTITKYRNKRNHAKFIEIKKYDNDRHYYIRQYMDWNLGFRNYIGRPNGSFTRIRMTWVRNDLLEDYEVV